jgi:hypothetical protein
MARWSLGSCLALQILFLAFDPSSPQGSAFNVTFGGTSNLTKLLSTLPMLTQVIFIGLKILLLIATLIGFFSSLVYTAWLFRRVPDIESMKTCLRYRWILPLVSVFGLCCMGLGPLIASVMYLNQLWKLRGYLKQAIESQQPRPDEPVAS